MVYSDLIVYEWRYRRYDGVVIAQVIRRDRTPADYERISYYIIGQTVTTSPMTRAGLRYACDGSGRQNQKERRQN